MVKTADIMEALGWTHLSYGPRTTQKAYRSKAKGAGKGPGRPNEDRQRELEKESRHLQRLKQKWADDLALARHDYKSFNRFLQVLDEEADAVMDKPGLVDWDVPGLCQELSLKELPINVRFMCLDQFRKYIRKVQRRHGWSEADDPFPRGFGGYTSDWDRVKHELEVR